MYRPVIRKLVKLDLSMEITKYTQSRRAKSLIEFLTRHSTRRKGRCLWEERKVRILNDPYDIWRLIGIVKCSGKSSLLNVLLRMMDITGELLIGHQLSVSFSNQELRRKINTIPQDPYFFPGTIRKNIDPDSTSSDAAIQASITKVGLDDEIAKVGGLDSDLLPETFSAGQLQLLSFARAILNPKGLLLLDEATSRYVSPS